MASVIEAAARYHLGEDAVVDHVEVSTWGVAADVTTRRMVARWVLEDRDCACDLRLWESLAARDANDWFVTGNSITLSELCDRHSIDFDLSVPDTRWRRSPERFSAIVGRCLELARVLQDRQLAPVRRDDPPPAAPDA